MERIRAVFRPAVVIVAAIAVLGVVAPVQAQPKLDIKVFAGASSTTYVDLLETGRERDTYFGWQVGFGGRLRKDAWFVEALLSFNRWSFRSSDVDLTETGFVDFRGRVNSFEFPLLAGWVAYKNPYFKLFIYGGYVNHFNTRLLATVTTEDGESESVKLRPKEVELAIYQALARAGLSFDLYMFNLDFNYSISMNSATTTPERNSYHQLQLNVAYLF